MPDNMQVEAPPSMTTLVQGIVSDVQDLIRQELTLARSEVKKNWKDLQQAGTTLGIAAVLLLLGGILLGFMAVCLLHEVAGIPSWWVCFLIVGGLLALAGGAFLVTGLHKASQVDIGPEQTIQSIKEIV